MECRNKENAVKQDSLNDSSESLVPPQGIYITIWRVSLSYSAETKTLPMLTTSTEAYRSQTGWNQRLMIKTSET